MRVIPDNSNQRKPATTMNAWERQQVFREMVLHQLRNGPLSRRRRKTIVQYAACLGINAVLAGRLVQEAQRQFDRERATDADSPPLRLVPDEPETHTRRRWRTILGITVGATMIQSWLILHWFG
jgi:hypothetical protein